MSLINISRTKLLQIQPVKICDRLCLSTLADPSMDNIQKLDFNKRACQWIESCIYTYVDSFAIAEWRAVIKQTLSILLCIFGCQIVSNLYSSYPSKTFLLVLSVILNTSNYLDYNANTNIPVYTYIFLVSIKHFLQ
jgi:hypothetical protein